MRAIATPDPLTGASSLQFRVKNCRSRRTIALCSSSNQKMAPNLPKISSPGGIDAFLFDMDGTLCDTDPLHHEVFSDLLLKHGKNNNKPIDDDFFHEHIAGKTNEAIFPALFPELDGKTHITMWEEKERAFRELAESKLKRLPGLTELLQWAKTMEITVVAVTNAPRPNADLMLKALQLENGFAHLVIGTECVRAKPHPEPYLEGLRLAGEVRNKSLDPKKCIAFEDSPTGMTAAVGAGIPTVGVMTSQSGLVLEEAGASVCISDFEDPQLMDAMA